MKKFEHPSITVQEPSPGFYVIEGFNPASVFVQGVGHLVCPASCIIPKEIPAELLRLIADAKEGKESPQPSARVPQPPAPAPVVQTPLQDEGADMALEQRVLNILAEGNIQITKLAERLDVTAEEIKALAAGSDGFHIAAAGWVKLGPKPSAE